jgi:Skp family chaperone for outer membrane proteins
MRSKILAACLALTLPAAAIELSLEENKAERGNIGYIDMQRLFRTFPETIRARENFEELLRQAEEQLNLRKAEILRLRSELAELRIEREFLAKTPIEVAQPQAKPAPSASPKSSAPEAPKGSAGLAAAAAAAKETRDRENAELAKLLEEARKNPAPAAPQEPVGPAPVSPAVAPQAPPAPPPPAPAPAESSGRRDAEPETDLTRPSIANLPGFSGIPASSQPVTQAAPPPPPPPPPPQKTGPSEDALREALEQSRKAAEAKKREPLVINIPGVSTAPIVVQPPAAPAAPPADVAAALPQPLPPAESVVTSTAPAVPALNPALVELDAKIAVKTKELAAKELELKEQQASSEKNLLDLESRKTEILLGKIHRAIQTVAHKEGVSVVVDKSSILYGHDAVDLTEKVVKYLRGS